MDHILPAVKEIFKAPGSLHLSVGPALEVFLLRPLEKTFLLDRAVSPNLMIEQGSQIFLGNLGCQCADMLVLLCLLSQSLP